ncbi:MAG: hypothetical protein M3Q19_03940 [Pseudomonadota bacterium]|nr:hypothetical protein [Pseudomonadota bacterium]
MNRIAFVASMLLLSACNSETVTEPPVNNVAADEPKQAAEVPSLAGSWSVTRIEGEDTAGLGMTARFTGGQASLAAGCMRRAWTYTQSRNIVSFKTNPAGSSNCEGRSPSGTEETAYAALDGANIAIFSKDGSEASLSGTGGSLTLQRR